MRVGVIGGGSMGQHHLKIYSEMKDVVLVGICDMDRDRAVSLAKSYNTTPYFDHKELLKQDIDAVSVDVQTPLHYSVAMDVINSGRHLLIEKPIADTLDHANKMIRAAHDAKVKLIVGNIERFSPGVQKIKNIIDSDMLGKIVSISSIRVGPLDPQISDVKIIMDLCVDDSDVISYLYDQKINEVDTIADKAVHSLEGHVSILFRCGANFSGMVEANWLTPQKIRNLTVIGLKGVAYLDYIKQTVELHDQDWSHTEKFELKGPFKNEVENFIEAIRNDIVISNGEKSRYALEVALAASGATSTNLRDQV